MNLITKKSCKETIEKLELQIEFLLELQATEGLTKKQQKELRELQQQKTGYEILLESGRLPDC